MPLLFIAEGTITGMLVLLEQYRIPSPENTIQFHIWFIYLLSARVCLQ